MRFQLLSGSGCQHTQRTGSTFGFGMASFCHIWCRPLSCCSPGICICTGARLECWQPSIVPSSESSLTCKLRCASLHQKPELFRKLLLGNPGVRPAAAPSQAACFSGAAVFHHAASPCAGATGRATNTALHASETFGWRLHSKGAGDVLGGQQRVRRCTPSGCGGGCCGVLKCIFLSRRPLGADYWLYV